MFETIFSPLTFW